MEMEYPALVMDFLPCCSPLLLRSVGLIFRSRTLVWFVEETLMDCWTVGQLDSKIILRIIRIVGTVG